MNSRERVLTALNHKEPDRIPYDLCGTAQTGIHVGAYSNLRRHLGLPSREANPRNLLSQFADPHEDFLEVLKVDVRHVPRRSTIGETYEQREEGNYWTRTDQWAITWRMPKTNGLYYDLWLSPFDLDDVAGRLNTYQWPDPTDPWHYELLREPAQKARDKGKAVVLQGFTAGILETYAWLRGYHRYFMDLATDHKTASYLLDKLVEIKAVYWQRALGELDGLVDIVNETDDIAAQHALMISPDTYRTLIKPRHQKLFAAIKKAAPGIKLFLHSCGAIRPLIPDFVEIGVDILNPIQLGAKDMNPVELKREFGRDLCFWGGGVDAQGVLTSGTPKQVREQVRKNMDALAPSGGFVFAADHVIQANVPPENFVAMWETFREHSSYS